MTNLLERTTKKTAKYIALIGMSACLTATPALAANIDSAYTALDLDQCNQLNNADFGDDGGDSARFACMGYNNSLVYVAEGDLRMFVAYGLDALNEISVHQTLPAFNTVHTTLEWRMSDESGQWVPFATILRWFTQVGDSSEPDGQTLVVTKLEPGNSCHVAYVDALIIDNANVIARQVADSAVATFDCHTDQPFHIPQ